MASHATIPRGTLKAVVRAPRCHEGDPLEMPLVHPLHQNPRGGIGASTISAVGTRACTAVATPVMAVPSPPLAPALASDAEHFCSGNGGAVSVPSVAGGDRQKWQLVLQQWPTHHFDDGVCGIGTFGPGPGPGLRLPVATDSSGSLFYSNGRPITLMMGSTVLSESAPDMSAVSMQTPMLTPVSSQFRTLRRTFLTGVNSSSNIEQALVEMKDETLAAFAVHQL